MDFDISLYEEYVTQRMVYGFGTEWAYLTNAHLTLLAEDDVATFYLPKSDTPHSDLWGSPGLILGTARLRDFTKEPFQNYEEARNWVRPWVEKRWVGGEKDIRRWFKPGRTRGLLFESLQLGPYPISRVAPQGLRYTKEAT